jgi:hypothetical protein
MQRTPALVIAPVRWLLLALVLLFAATAAQARVDQRRLQVTLYDYAGAMRWGDVSQILSFFDKSEKAAPAPTPFELERWKQWKVVGYRAQPYTVFEDGHVEQRVEIELSNINTLATRTVIDRQRWRYEKKRKAWLLVSGLPNLSQ